MASTVLGSNLGQELVDEAPMLDDEAIKPGMLIALDSSGNAIKHATAGGNVNVVAIAMPEDYQTFRDDFANVSAFANGERIRYSYGYGKRYGWCAASQTIVKGDLLESAGDGTLRKHTAGDETTSILHARVVGVALQALSTGVGVTKQILFLPRQ